MTRFSALRNDSQVNVKKIAYKTAIVVINRQNSSSGVELPANYYGAEDCYSDSKHIQTDPGL